MHKNNGSCEACRDIIFKYDDPHQDLVVWFYDLQREHPECHCSCFGRGKIDQEAAFARGASKAHYGESAHSYNCAIDLFELRDGAYTLDKDWFGKVVSPRITDNLKWLGAPKSPFFELPHVEIANYRALREKNLIKLVE